MTAVIDAIINGVFTVTGGVIAGGVGILTANRAIRASAYTELFDAVNEVFVFLNSPLPPDTPDGTTERLLRNNDPRIFHAVSKFRYACSRGNSSRIINSAWEAYANNKAFIDDSGKMRHFVAEYPTKYTHYRVSELESSQSEAQAHAKAKDNLDTLLSACKAQV